MTTRTRRSAVAIGLPPDERRPPHGTGEDGPMMDLSGAVLEHANRGVRLQLLLRGALVVFLLLTIVLIPPDYGVAAYYGIVAIYAVGALAFAVWAWPGGAAVARWGWASLFVDLAVLTTLTLIAGVDAHESWTSNVLVLGFFLVP